MSVDDWADQARQSQYRQSAEQQQVIDILKILFEGKEDPDRASNKIASIYNPVLRSSFNSSPVFELWTMLCEAAKTLGGNREIDERIVSLLNSISKLPDVNDVNGNPIDPGNGYKGVYWRDLPGLAIVFREYAIGMLCFQHFAKTHPNRNYHAYQRTDIEPETSEMPDEGDWTDAQKATLVNVVTFGALYLANGRRDLGMAFHAEVSFLEGIEEPYQTSEQQRRAATMIPPAATWILLAGKKIYELCQIDDGKNGKGRPFSLERWSLWKRKFGEIAMNPALSTSVKNIAAKAASEMGEIES